MTSSLRYCGAYTRDPLYTNISSPAESFSAVTANTGGYTYPGYGYYRE
jgi:hypothetical protein